MSNPASITIRFSSIAGFENEFSTSCNEFITRLSTLAYSKIDYISDNNTFTMWYDRIQHFNTTDIRHSIKDLNIQAKLTLYVYDGEEDAPREYLCLNNEVIRVQMDDIDLCDLREDL